MNVWTAYHVGVRTKTGGDGSLHDVVRWAMRHWRQPERLSWLMTPIDFLRYREFDFALRTVGAIKSAPRRILDLSSPKLLPLTLADQFPDAQVLSTDVLQREVDWVTGKASLLRLGNLQGQTEDARGLSFADDSFDLITSISVFEHIAPEADGDYPAIYELSRVLAPGGTAIITVPCSRTYLADYQSADVYERPSDGRPIFFQRFYTPRMLHERFVLASGLELARLNYVEEQYFFSDPKKRVAHWVNCSPAQNRVFGPLFPLLSHIFLSPPRPLEKCRKPYIACIVLKKPLPQAEHAPMRLAA